MAKRTDELLRGAIADAKAVRETALANAKAALEEAFTPHLTSMLSARMKNETDYGDDDDLDELNDPVSGDGHGSDDGGETDVDAVEKSSFIGEAEGVDDRVDNDAAGLDSSGIATEPTSKYGTSSPKDPDADARTPSDIKNDGLEQPAGHKVSEGIFEMDDDEDEFDEDPMAPDLGMEGEPEPDMGMDMGMEGEPEHGELDAGLDLGMGDEEEEEDLDLEAVIRELEADMVDEMGDEEVPMGDEDELGDLEDEPVIEGAGSQNDAEVSDGHGPGEGGEKDAEANVASTFTSTGQPETGAISEGEEEGEDIDLEEILREIEDEESEDDIKVEVTGLRSELKEYRTAVKFLRSKLHEVNLLNAKLLFTNKLFKSYNMDVRQKMRVVENFDRATTPREAKLVYTTLAETFRGKPVTRKRSITEGLASRAGGSTKPRGKNVGNSSTPTVLAEGADLAARFKKLAGIKS